MTRQEAIKTMAGGWFGPSEVAEKWIDMFVKLGMLKLEEPKSARQKYDDALRGVVAREWIDRYWDMIERAGLKIVKK